MCGTEKDVKKLNLNKHVLYYVVFAFVARMPFVTTVLYGYDKYFFLQKSMQI